MTDRKELYQELRAVLSIFAVFSAVLLCHTLRHFTIELGSPSTWYLATQHRCGWVLIATLTWFLCEMTNRLRLEGQSLRRARFRD
jgi:hypothetical protein